MRRIEGVTVDADLFGAGLDGFTEGVPDITPATVLSAQWANDVQEEIVNAAEAGGAPLSTARTDLRTSIARQLEFLSFQAVQVVQSEAANEYRAQCYHPSIGHLVVGDTGDTWNAPTLHGPMGYVYAGDTQNLFGCATNGAVFVAVGASGRIWTSPDGSAWTARTAAGGFAGTFQAVFWSEARSLFVAVGTSGTIQTSPTGTTWTARTAGGGSTATWECVGDNGGTLVIAGSGGQIQTSTDAITWTARTPAGGYTGNWRSVVWTDSVTGASRWVLGGDNEAIQTSALGTTWAAGSLGPEVPNVGGGDGNAVDVLALCTTRQFLVAAIKVNTGSEGVPAGLAVYVTDVLDLTAWRRACVFPGSPGAEDRNPLPLWDQGLVLALVEGSGVGGRIVQCARPLY